MKGPWFNSGYGYDHSKDIIQLVPDVSLLSGQNIRRGGLAFQKSLPKLVLNNEYFI